MMLLLFAVFLGALLLFQTSGTINDMAEDNIQMAVDMQNAANSMGLSTLLPMMLVVFIVVIVIGIITSSMAFSASYDAE